MSAFSYALNSYFTTKRSRATGLALTITGLGPILMPQVTSIFIAYYGFQGTMLLYGAFSLHSLIGSVLLQPIKWHMKPAPLPAKELMPLDLKKINEDDEEEKNATESEAECPNGPPEVNHFEHKRRTTMSSIDHDVEVGRIYGFETPLSRQLSEAAASEKFNDAGMPYEQKQVERSWWPLAKSLHSINLGSSMKIFEEHQSEIMPRYYSIEDLTKKNNNDCNNDISIGLLLQKVSNDEETAALTESNGVEKKSRLSRIFKRIVDFYDLTLLLDPIYVNIMAGMSIAIFAEINFSLLTPFILSDMGLSTKDIAWVMSLVATADLISRSIAPYLGEWLRQPPRTMYLLSLTLLVLSRTSLIFASTVTSIIFIAIGLGAAKGIRSVYMVLVVPTYVPIERLPYASGIQMIINGVIVMSAGPLLGLVRDITGSYTPCIVIMNAVTMLTVTLWTCEMCIVRWRKMKKKERTGQES